MKFPTYLRDLHAFCLAVNLGSITAAADKLGETKGAVSRRISRLEQELGVQLLLRSTRVIKATEQGAAYRQFAADALSLLDDGGEVVQSSKAPAGLLRIATSPGLAIWLGAMMGRFAETYPQIKVELILVPGQPDFSHHEVDVAVQSSTTLRDSSLIARKITDAPGVLVAAPTYLARRGRPQIPPDLTQHQLLLGQLSGKRVIQISGIAGAEVSEETMLEFEVDIYSANNPFIRESAISGAGIAAIGSIMVADDLAFGRLVRVLPEYRLNREAGAIYLVRPRFRSLPPRIKAFWDFMISLPKG